MSTLSTHRHQRGTLAVVCAGTAMLMLDIAVVNTALPRIARDLHSGLSGVQWVLDAYAVVLAAVVLSAGSVADRRGRRLVFATGMVIFTASSLACALAGSVVFLDGVRAVQGLGGAMMFASSLAILADAFPQPRERAGAMAAYGATIGAAFAFGPTIGGALTTWLDWRAVFFINIPLGLCALAGTAAWVRESRSPHWRPLDWPGQVTLSGALFVLVLALLRGNADGWASTQIIGELAAAALLLAGFVLAERLVPAPMLPLRMFARRDFTVNLLGNAMIALFDHPDQARLLRERPELIKGAVEEFLRFDTSVEYTTMRFAARDTELGGVRIARGDIVVVSLTSANRSDPGLAPAERDTLDVSRPAARHLAFGHGIHRCLGAPLAQLEAEIGIGTLLRRFPHLRPTMPTAELSWIAAGMMRGPLSLPVSVTPPRAPRQ